MHTRSSDLAAIPLMFKYRLQDGKGLQYKIIWVPSVRRTRKGHRRFALVQP